MLGWINDTRLFNRGAWCAQRDFETLWGHLTIRHIRRHGLFFLTDRWDQKRTPALHASLSLLIRRQSLFSAPSSLFLKGESLHLLAFFGVSFFVPDKALCIDYLESAAAYKKKVTTCHLYIAFGLYYGFQLPLWSCVTCWCIRQLPVEKTPLPNPWKIQIKCGVSSEVWCMLIRAAKENVLTLGILIAEKKKNQPSKPATPCYIKNGTAHQVFFFHDSEISHSTAFLLEVKKNKKKQFELLKCGVLEQRKRERLDAESRGGNWNSCPHVLGKWLVDSQWCRPANERKWLNNCNHSKGLALHPTCYFLGHSKGKHTFSLLFWACSSRIFF